MTSETSANDRFLLISDYVQAMFGRHEMLESDEISPDAAAEILGMSRAMVLHRIEQLDLPSLKLSDVLAFKAREDRARSALAEFGRLTDEMDG
jgi:hypothetical protein